MKQYDEDFAQSLGLARERGIAPVWFFWVEAKNRSSGAAERMGFWSGDEDLNVSVTPPDGGASESRLYLGGCNLQVSDMRYVADLTDNPVTVSLSQVAPSVQELVRTHDVRLAACEIHATTLDGGRFISAPELQWVGVIDASPISTPSVGGSGQISLSVRSEIMHQLTAINPAKSSNAHQRRRSGTDRFCEYASTISSRTIEWFKSS